MYDVVGLKLQFSYTMILNSLYSCLKSWMFVSWNTVDYFAFVVHYKQAVTIVR